MEGRRFDAIVRAIGDASSRRSLLTRGFTGTVGLVLTVTGSIKVEEATTLAKETGIAMGRPHTPRGRVAEEVVVAKGKGGKGGKAAKKNECETNGDCRQPENPCEKKVCKGGKCLSAVRQDGAECGTGQVCAGGACVASRVFSFS